MVTFPAQSRRVHPRPSRSRPVRSWQRLGRLTLALCAGATFGLSPARAANAALVAWSESGLQESDGADVSVFALAPPGATLRAQLMIGGKLVTNATGLTVTYEAVADGSGSINTTSRSKSNLPQFAEALLGTALADDAGLSGFDMPGPANAPQAMRFDPARHWFSAEAIPITGIDDAGRPNAYPLMRLVARNGTGAVVASTDVALPVADGMNCRSCHGSGAQDDARPAAGWTWDPHRDRDYRLNILRSHDAAERGRADYTQALAEVGYHPDGLTATVLELGRPILCTRCHASNAHPGSGATDMRPLTQLMHTKHAFAKDPDTGQTLTALAASESCLHCHAGPEPRRLRGVHHRPVNDDGTHALQCQSCHGTMTELGSTARAGWIDGPKCQSCHTGTATQNAGALRYLTVFTEPGVVRPAANLTFAIHTNATLAGTLPYHDGVGHGGLSCAACHGSAHAEAPGSQPNDAAHNLGLQGDAGVLTTCGVCHPTVPRNRAGGPHGLHPVDQQWARDHEESRTQCQVCHGTDYRGTVLSRMQVDNTFNTYGTKHFWRGFQIGCYNCHGGPNSEDATSNRPAVVTNLDTNTPSGVPVSFTLASSDPNGNPRTLRVVTPPPQGTVTLDGSRATYHPAPDFLGSETFTFAAWDGSTDSGLGTVRVSTTPGDCQLTAHAYVPTAVLPGRPVAFHAVAALRACEGTIDYAWDFGDGSPAASGPTVSHDYGTPGDYAWTLTVSANGLSQVFSGQVAVSPTLGPPVQLAYAGADFLLGLSWPLDRIPIALETTTDPADPKSWVPYWEHPEVTESNSTATVFVLPGQQFFRLRRVP